MPSVARHPLRSRFDRAARAVVRFSLVAGVAIAWPAPAHRIDDALQAVRVGLGEDHVRLELDISPGAVVARHFLGLIDLDRDERISDLEAAAYGDWVGTRLTLELDGRARAVQLDTAECPAPEILRAGSGTIRLVFRVETPAWKPGAHEVRVLNRHETARSVHLANALLPESGRLTILAQERDSDQRDLRIRFTAGPSPGTEVR